MHMTTLLETIMSVPDFWFLRRPFDLQEQPLIRLQTEAVISLLALLSEKRDLVRSQAQALENSLTHLLHFGAVTEA
jgi:hypothetical protein